MCEIELRFVALGEVAVSSSDKRGQWRAAGIGHFLIRGLFSKKSVSFLRQFPLGSAEMTAPKPHRDRGLCTFKSYQANSQMHYNF